MPDPREADGFKIQDLNSRNSTFVNGVPVTEQILASGDEIKIGNSLFVFVLPETEPTPERLFGGVRSRPIPAPDPTIILRKQDARYLRDLEKINPTGRMVRDLNALLRISKAVNSVRGLEALEKQVLELIFEVAPADRAAILLCDQGIEEPTSVFGWDRRTGPNHAVQVSRTIVSQVLAGRRRRCCATICRAPRHSARHGERHGPAYPQRAGGSAGSIRSRPGSHLSGCQRSGRYASMKITCSLLTAIGSIAAPALDNARSAWSGWRKRIAGCRRR